MEGVVTQTPARSIVFNTGMVMHGWLDLHELTGEQRFLDAARRGGEWLAARQDEDGAWRGEMTLREHPAHLQLPRGVGPRTARPGRRRRALRRVRAPQARLGRVRSAPERLVRRLRLQARHVAQHALIAYTLRGLLESGLLLGERTISTPPCAAPRRCS